MGRVWARLTLALTLGAAAPGCSTLTTYNVARTYPPESASVTFVDAKQRAILSAPGPNRESPLRFCAEPSPDALAALAGSTSLSGSGPRISVAAAASLSEAVGSIGLRTQSITLMRDAMYRICEGYVSGALSKQAYENLFRRFQSSMVAILAIEQLTGTVKAQQLVLGSAAAAGNAQAVLDLTTKTADARTALKKTSDDQAVAQADNDAKAATSQASQAAAAAESDATKKKPLQDKATADAKVAGEAADVLKAKKQAASDAADALKAIDTARVAALAASNATSASGSFSSAAIPALASGDSLGKIATAVASIVSDTEGLSFTKELCTTALETSDSTVAHVDPQVTAACLELLKAGTSSLLWETAARLGAMPDKQGGTVPAVAGPSRFLSEHYVLDPPPIPALPKH